MNNQQLLKIEGPFKEKNQLTPYISRKYAYEYKLTFSQTPTAVTLQKLHLIITYDEGLEESFTNKYSNSKVRGTTLSIQLHIHKGLHQFKIAAYLDHSIALAPPLEVHYKQVVTFFIGGAGDATSYYGAGPHYITRDQVKIPFEQLTPKEGHTARYMGYAAIYGAKNIAKNILSLLPNKTGCSVNIVGFSLGGWNGAHLSQILTNKGYTVNMLLTLDPVGINIGVKLVSNIYWNLPQPSANYWVNSYTNPPRLEGDDVIARLGGQWIPPADAVQVLHETRYHHKEVGQLFYDIIQPTISAADLLLHFINQFLATK